ncbi:PTS system mannose/fructose/sorbose family transporter subunit IID [Enterococcus casseliflavus]|nr:PTS system mannose/fructose/sorbose family transporter subunit IID [Enterococcus casseliflavus]
MNKKVKYSVLRRWFFTNSMGWNYEKMQGLGYYYAMYPFIMANYRTVEEQKKAAKTHLQFYNCNNTATSVVLGSALALEEKQGTTSLESVSSLKTGLMGPLSGIGDSLFHVLPSTILGSIISYMALDGNPIGLIFWLIWGCIRAVIMYYLFKVSNDKGSQIVGNIGNNLKTITNVSSVLGITVIGGMIPSIINFKFIGELKFGEVSLGLQEFSDKLLPGLLPLMLVGFIYWMLSRKHMNSIRVIILVFILGLLLSLTGLFGV